MSEQKRGIVESLKRTLDHAEWSWLKPHALRDAVILVNEKLDLLDVAYRIAVDDKAVVKDWLETAQINRPTPAQVEEWNRTPQRKFLMIIVQPYILIQVERFH